MRVDLLTFGPHVNTCASWISVKRKHRLNKSWSIEGPTESCNDQTAKKCINFVRAAPIIPKNSYGNDRNYIIM